MVPFIDLDDLDTENIIRQIGNKLLDLFSMAYSVVWNMGLQKNNIESFLNAEKSTFGFGPEIRRAFVYHFCIYLNMMITNINMQKALSPQDAMDIVRSNRLPQIGE